MKRLDITGELNPRWSRDHRVTIGQKFGNWEIISNDVFQKSSALYVHAKCKCGIEKEVNLRFIETGRSTQCKSCASKQNHLNKDHFLVDTRIDHLLQKRANAMYQRCNNPNDQSYKNYGARGIEFKFNSIKECVDYIKETLPHETYLNLDIDRKDNSGHYEPGNLHLVTRKENLYNKRTNVRVVWKGQSILLNDWKQNPYSHTCSGRYAQSGMTGEEILEQAWKAVYEKRKGWKELKRKLESMTF